MFVVQEKPNSIASESYRTLRTNIEYSSFDESLKTIVVTSSEPNEGKTTTAGNLAISLAHNEKKVLLIDCDLRRGTIHRRFKISNAEGLSEIIVGKTSIEKVVREVTKNLGIITTGNLPPNPSEMLASKCMGDLINKLREGYDYIILDAPPVLAVTDAQILSTKVDGTLLVARAEKTKKNSIVNAKKLLEKVNANIVGIVFNGIDMKKTNYYSYCRRGEKKRKKIRKKEKSNKKGILGKELERVI